VRRQIQSNFLGSFTAIAIALIVTGLNLNVRAAQQFINGDIGFFGSLNLDAPWVIATATTGYSHVTANGFDGNYTNIPSQTSVSFTPFTFNPADGSVISLWSCTNNGVTYSVDATSMTLVNPDYASSGFLNIRGSGIAHVTGFADTPGTWLFATSLPPSDGQNTYQFVCSFSCSETNMPVLQTAIQTNGQIVLSWNALSGQPYQVQYTTNLIRPDWNNLGDVISTTNSTVTVTNSIGTDPQQFYRVVLLP